MNVITNIGNNVPVRAMSCHVLVNCGCTSVKRSPPVDVNITVLSTVPVHVYSVLGVRPTRGHLVHCTRVLVLYSVWRTSIPEGLHRPLLHESCNMNSVTERKRLLKSKGPFRAKRSTKNSVQWQVIVVWNAFQLRLERTKSHESQCMHECSST